VSRRSAPSLFEHRRALAGIPDTVSIVGAVSVLKGSREPTEETGTDRPTGPAFLTPCGIPVSADILKELGVPPGESGLLILTCGLPECRPCANVAALFSGGLEAATPREPSICEQRELRGFSGGELMP